MPRQPASRLRRFGASVAAAALLPVLAACGGSAATQSPAQGSTKPHKHTPGMRMNGAEPDAAMGPNTRMGDASLPKAQTIAGATLLRGDFALLPTRPPGTDGVTGTAWLAHSTDRGTTVTIEFRGLPPKQDYLAHVHAQPCGQDAGGPHFQFLPGGPAAPPNEIHLAFTSGKDGAGLMTAINADDVGTRARSVVVHPADAMDSRLACADLGR